MSSEPLPDHYKSLGIDKNADAATIKKTYRKLVLTCHPDKVTDEALKAQKQDEFHKIQQAYETLSDETRRATYEAELQLQQLRREKLARTASGSTVEQKSARFAQPTAGGGSYTAHTSSRFNTEERRPSGAAPSSRRDYDDDYYRSSRKDSYFPSPRRQSPRPSPSSRSSKERVEKEVRREKASTDRTRSSTQKTRDSERRDRTARFPVDSDGSSEEERARYERERAYKTRPAEDDSRRREEYRRDDRRYDDMFEHTSPRKLSVQERTDDAMRYITKSRAAADIRPSTQRTTSRDYYEPSSRSSRHREVQPEAAPRRSSAKPKERPGMSSRRDADRGIPDIVDWERPAFTKSTSSSADIRIPSQRSTTDSYRRERSPPRPYGLNRSNTMPVNPGSEAGGSRREPKSYPRPSGLRNEANSSPERDAYLTSSASQSQNTTYYKYSAADGGVKVSEAPSHHTVLREPGRTRHRSPSPIGKPPMGANRPSLHSAKTYAPGRTSRQSSPVREEPGRSGQMNYGEVPLEYTRRRGMGERQPSYDTHNVSFAPRYGREDVRWTPRGREGEYVERKPGLSRAATTSVFAH